MALEDLKQYSRLLDSDRITKRRKAAEEVSHLLNNNNIVIALSNSSRQTGTFNWDQLFLSSKYFFLKEAEKLEHDERQKENPSTATINLWANHKRVCGALPKLVLKKSGFGNFCVSLQHVLDFVFLIMGRSRPYLLENFAGTALQIVQNYILKQPQYYLYITQDKWRELLRSCLLIHDKKAGNVDVITIIVVIEGIFKHFKISESASSQRMSPSTVLRYILPFLRKVTNVDHGTSGTQSALLSLLFTICNEFGTQWRYAICRLSEESFDYFLNQWEDRESNNQIMLLKFFNLQIMMHHPQQDGFLPEKSTFCSDSATWDRNLGRLYICVYESLIKHCQNSYLGLSTTDTICLSEAFVDLSSRLFSKLFEECDDSNFDISQLRLSCSIQTSSSSRATKRRRIELGFVPMCDQLMQEGASSGYIPWYQIIRRMLVNHSSFFNLQRCNTLLEIFTHLITQTKSSAVLEEILRCILSLSQRFSTILESPISHHYKIKWTAVWDSTLRLVCGSNCVNAGIELLCNLLTLNFVNVDCKLYTLFLRGIVPVNNYGLNLLEALLKVYPLQDQLKDEIILSSSPAVNSLSYLLRILLHMETDLDISVNFNAINYPEELCNVLSLLKMENPSKFKKLSQQNTMKSSASLSLEEIYLKSTFSYQIKVLPCSTPSPPSSERVKTEVENEILEKLKTFIDQKLPVGVIESSENTLDLALNIIELLVHLSFTFDDKGLLQYFGKQKVIMECLEKIWNQDDSAKYDLHQPLKRLFCIYKCAVEQLKANPSRKASMMELLKKIPASLLNLACNIVQDVINFKTHIPSQVSLATQLHSSHRNNNITIDSTYDSDFDDFEMPSDTVEMVDDFDEFDGNKDQNGTTSEDSEKGTLLLFNNHMFIKKDACALVACQWLCCVYELNILIDPNYSDDESAFMKVMDDFASLAEKGEINDCALVFFVIDVLFSMTYQEENVDDGITMLSFIAKKHSRDPRVSFGILQLIKNLLINNGSNLSASQEVNLVHYVKVFANKYTSGWYGSNFTQSLYEVNLELTKLDPLRKWSSYTVNLDERCEELYSLLRNPYHEIRMLAAQSLPYLFVDKNDNLLPLDHQKDKFQNVYQIAIESLSVEEGTNFGDFLQDEGNCRVISFLSALSNVALSSPFLESQALYALFCSPKVHKVDGLLVKTALRSIANNRKMKLLSYLEDHIMFILRQWIKDGHDIRQFCYLLLDLESESAFLHAYKDMLTVILFQEDKVEDIDVIVSVLDINVHELFQKNLSQLLAFLMPYLILTLTPNWQQSSNKIKIFIAQKLFKHLQSKLGDEIMMNHINKHLGDVIFTMLEMSHDSNLWVQDEIIIPPHNIYFESNLVSNAIENMHKIFFKDDDSSSVVVIMNRQKHPLYIVLHGLVHCMEKATLKHQFRCSLSKIETFLKVIIPYIGSGLGKMNSFVVRKLLYVLTSYTHKLYAIDDNLAGKCNEMLINFVTTVLKESPQAIISSLTVLLQRLVSLIQFCEKLRESSSKIIFEILSSGDKNVQNELVPLQFYPVDGSNVYLCQLKLKHSELVSKLHVPISLKQNTSFLLEMCPNSININTLTGFLDLLKERKTEMVELVESVDLSGQKYIHKLLNKLIAIITSSSDPEIVSCAANCLGEIGPIDLQTEVFTLDENSKKELHKSVYKHLLTLLHKMSFESGIHLMDIACNILKKVLSTPAGLEAVNSLTESLRLEVCPFTSGSKIKSVNEREIFDSEVFRNFILKDSLWKCNNNFHEWITTLTPILIKSGCGCNFLHSLEPLCAESSSFCSEVLPHLFYRVLNVDLSARRPVLSKMMRYLINNCMEILSQDSISSQKDYRLESECRKVIQVVLKILNYLRLQEPQTIFSHRKKLTCWEKFLWLDLDFYQVAKAAFNFGQHFTALFFAEVACELLEEDKQFLPSGKEHLKTRLQRRQSPPLERISHLRRGQEICLLLFEIYYALDSSEGVEGCSYAGRASTVKVQSALCHHRKQLLQSLSLSDAEEPPNNLIDGFGKIGMYNVLDNLLKASPLEQQDDKMLEARAECAWRLGKWDDEFVSVELAKNASEFKTNFGFNQYFLKSLIGLKKKSPTVLRESLKDAEKGLICRIQETGNESCRQIYLMLSQLKILSECANITKNILLENGSLCLDRLSDIDMLDDTLIDKECLEIILSARISTLTIIHHLTMNKASETQLFKLLMEKCDLAKMFPLSAISHLKSSILQAEKLSLNAEETWQLKIQKALMNESFNNNRQAVTILQDVLKDAESMELRSGKQNAEYCKALTLCGQFLMNSCTTSPKIILENFFLKSVQILESNSVYSKTSTLCKSYQKLAYFSDKLHEKTNEFLNSDQMKKRKEQLIKSEKELLDTEKLFKATRNLPEEKEVSRKRILLGRDMNKERLVFTKYEEEKEFYLKLSLENYFKGLVSSVDNEFTIFRIIALWFDNLKEKHVNDCVARYAKILKTHQFLPLLYQLVARLTTQDDSHKHHRSFPEILSLILSRICKDHPHHALPVVLMLANSHLDAQYQKGAEAVLSKSTLKRRTSSKLEPSVSNLFTEDRVKAAQKFVNQLKGEELAEHLSELETVCEAYIQLAYSDIDNTMLTSKHQLSRLRHLKFTASLVRPIAVQPSCSYSPPLIVRWHPKMVDVGGINHPKKLTIYTSDGFQYNELLKGNDDLRQDAVLQQVFNVVNNLLQRNSEAKKMKLHLRTYLVVPLSQKCGLIEWCSNTIALQSYIQKAHTRYYPEELQMQRAGLLFHEVAKSDHESLLNRFEEILDAQHPVLRFYFFEHYPHPEQWYIHRQLYSRSVAATSITGFIFGIGDRHLNNILLDMNTAELIHIDLGIAFESGHLLPTPETVPFRLTQNIIDGLGVTGVEGCLRKSMETTLTVLRKAQSILSTIVDVLRHDPLYQWSLTPGQVARLQNEDGERHSHDILDSSRSMAERSLLRVQQKLNGLQDGLVFSVEDHVSFLIQQATDPNNLSRLYHGWRPFV